MTSIGIIPARGGSKRIPGKNIRPFAGRPLLVHSIIAAQAAGVFDAIIVTTDDEAVARIAREHGAETPFARPAELASDHTPLAPVLLHALEALETAGRRYRNFCCLFATAPLMRAEDIRRGLALLEQHQAATAISVAQFPIPLERALTITPEGRLRMCRPEHQFTRSQDLPPAFYEAAHFTWGNVERFRAAQAIYGPNAVAVPIHSRLVCDIDTQEDWERAELMHRCVTAQEATPA